MSAEPTPIDLRPAQYRSMAVGFCVPVVCAGWGLGVPLHAIVSPSLRLFAYVISLPPIMLIAWMQFQLWRATQSAGGPARRARLAGLRRLLLIPFLVIAAGLLLSGGVLLTGLPQQPPPAVPVHALLVISLVVNLIGACFLPLAARARSYLPFS